MAVLTQQRRDLLDALSAEFLHNYRHGRTLLAVDGVDTSRFADDLAVRMGRGGHAVFRASIDAFQRPRADRFSRGKDTPRGYYEDSYDYDLFRRVLVEPFLLGGSAGFVTAAFDWRRDIPVEMDWRTGPADATLIVDGVFLNRPELRGLWSSSIWLDAPTIDTDERTRGGRALYLAESGPRTVATVIVDNTDPDAPTRVFADSC